MKLVDNANIVLLPNNVGIIFYVFSMKTVCPLEWFVEHEIRSNDCYKFCEKGKNYNTYKNYEMWKRFEYGNCKKKYIHAWLNWLTMQTKRINIKTNVWCYDFKVRYKIKGCFRQGIDFEYSTSLSQYQRKFIWINMLMLKKPILHKSPSVIPWKNMPLICPPHILTS